MPTCEIASVKLCFVATDVIKCNSSAGTAKRTQIQIWRYQTITNICSTCLYLGTVWISFNLHWLAYNEVRRAMWSSHKWPILHPPKIGLWLHPCWQGSWGQHGAHLGPTGPRWAPRLPHDLCYLGYFGHYLEMNSIGRCCVRVVAHVRCYLLKFFGQRQIRQW